MSINTAAQAIFVDNVERTVLNQLEDNKPDMVRSLFSSVPWQEGDGEKVTFNSIALSGFAPRVDENEDYNAINPTNGNELSKTQIQFGDKLEISRRMMKFGNRTPQVMRFGKKLSQRVKNTLDLEMTMQIFAEADATTFTPPGKAAYNIATSDAAALASGSHSYGGISFSNILSGGGALGMDNLNTLIEQGQQGTPDDFGTYLSPDYNTIVIADNIIMLNACKQLFGSSLSPETGNNAVNYYGGTGQFRVVALKHGNKTPTGATSSNNIYRWMLLDSEMSKEGFQLMVAEEPTTEQKFVNEDNLIAKLLVTQFAAYAAVQPQGTLYSLATVAPTIY
tara:strand:- start:360 stop:1367 length:1008 start_codon:yes stop_codon:yes gene_type:complete